MNTATTAAARMPLHTMLHAERQAPSRSSFSKADEEALLKLSQAPQQQPKRVQFSEARVVGTVPHHADLSVEHAQQIWWQPSELHHFKNEARTLCRQLRQLRKEQPQQQPMQLPRGLEQRICCQRQKHRYLAIRCVLKAQQRSRSEEFIAMVSRKCTTWASDVARLEGQADYYNEYHPHLVATLPKVSDIPMPALPIQQRQSAAASPQSCQKRSFCEDSDSDNDSVETHRSVRARTSAD